MRILLAGFCLAAAATDCLRAFRAGNADPPAEQAVASLYRTYASLKTSGLPDARALKKQPRAAPA